MPETLSEVDYKIISSLAKNSRKTVTQIAKDVGISRPTAILRLKKLRGNNIVSLGAGVNVTKLGFKLALVALKSKGTETSQKQEKNVALCPRVLLLIHTGGNPEYLALIYSENMETLVSVLECFKSASDMEIISWHRLKPPLIPETFELKVFPTKRKLTLCGKKCGDCFSYQNLECLGCPAVTEYKGPL